MNDVVPKANAVRREHITADYVCTRAELQADHGSQPNMQGNLNNHAPIMHTACHCCICDSEGTVSLGVVFRHLKSGSRSLPHHCQK